MVALLSILFYVLALLSRAASFLFELGPINILVVTDVHSWVAGHLPHEPQKDADYGDVLSFAERLRLLCDENGKDLFFVMNGDFMDGTGLSTIPPTYLVPILQQMPFDAVNMGNHELYHNEVIEYITKQGGFVDFWEDRYLTSNILLDTTNESIGEKYMYLNASNSNSRILTFGFLYNFQRNCDSTTVLNVESVVNSTWFTNVLNNKDFDGILVLAHMDAFDPLVEVILNQIRTICGDDMSVQFITGHSHQRKFGVLDNQSTSFEAGHFLDTLGLVSFPVKGAENISHSNASFSHQFIDTSVSKLEEILEIDPGTLKTKRGRALSNMIRKTQQDLGLLDVLGCAPKTLDVYAGLNRDDSLWGFYQKEIMPLIFDGSSNKIMIQNSGSFRYSLFEGNISVTDLSSVNPFNDNIMLIGEEISGAHFQAAFGIPNFVDPNATGRHSELPKYVVCCDIDFETKYDVYGVSFDASFLIEQLENVTDRTFELSGSEVGTTDSLWRKFISTNWQCTIDSVIDEEEERRGKTINDFLGKFTWFKLIGLFLSFIVMSLLGWMFMTRGETRIPRYDGASDIDDESYSSESLSYGEGARSIIDSSHEASHDKNATYHSIENRSII